MLVCDTICKEKSVLHRYLVLSLYLQTIAFLLYLKLLQYLSVKQLVPKSCKS